jgi:hypothetical protein
MRVILNGGRMAAVFPESPVSFFAYIVFPRCPAGDQLDGLGQRIAMPRILDEKMNMFRCDGEIKYR